MQVEGSGELYFDDDIPRPSWHVWTEICFDKWNLMNTNTTEHLDWTPPEFMFQLLLFTKVQT